MNEYRGRKRNIFFLYIIGKKKRRVNLQVEIQFCVTRTPIEKQVLPSDFHLIRPTFEQNILFHLSYLCFYQSIYSARRRFVVRPLTFVFQSHQYLNKTFYSNVLFLCVSVYVGPIYDCYWYHDIQYNLTNDRVIGN